MGGHKRNKRICELVGKTLLSRYPEHYRRIVELFPKENKRIGGAKQVLPDMTVQQCIALYQDYLCDRLGEWKSLSVEELYRLEKRLSDYSRFLGADKEAQLGWRIGKNPYVSVFELPRTWPGLAKVLLKFEPSRVVIIRRSLCSNKRLMVLARGLWWFFSKSCIIAGEAPVMAVSVPEKKADKTNITIMVIMANIMGAILVV